MAESRIRLALDGVQSVIGGLNQVGERIGQVAGSIATLTAIGGTLSIAAFAGWIKGSIDAADAASKLSVKTGVAVKDVAGLQLAFQLAGLEGDAMASSMSKLSKGMVDGSKTLDALGIKSKNLDGTFKSTKDVMYSVSDAFAGLDDGAQKTALAIGLFGKSGADMIPLLNGGSEGLREMDEMAQKLGLTISESTAKDAESFSDTLDLIKMGSQGVANGIAAQLLPTLTSLAGSFLESMTSGDKLKKTADFLATSMKLLYTVGVGVVGAFSAVGKTLGAAGAQLVAFFSGDFKLAAQIGREWSADMSADWKDTAKTISDAWDTSGNASVASMAKLVKSTKLIDTEDKKAKKSTAEKISDYEKLTRSINEKIAADEQQLALGRPLSESEKILTKMLADRATGAIKLTNTELDAIKVAIKKLGATEQLIEADKYYAEQAKKTYDASSAAIKSATDEADKNEELARTFGMTKTAVEQLELARLEEQLAQKGGIAACTAETAALDALIAAKKRNIAAVGTVEALEVEKKFNDDRLAEQKKTVEQYDDIFRTGFADMVNGGKNTWKSFTKSLTTTFKTSVADQIYKMFAQPFVVKFVASMMGIVGGGVASSAAAAGGSSLVESAAGSAIGNYGMSAITLGGSTIAAIGSSVATGVAAGWAGTSVAGASAAYGAAGMTGVSTGLSVGSSIGAGLAAIPVWGWALAAVAVVAALGGRGEKKITERGVEGTFGGTTGFSGNAYAKWEQDGGWFHSDRDGKTPSALDAATQKQFADSFSAMQASATGLAKSLALDTDSIDAYSKKLSIKLTGKAEEDSAAISAAFAGMSEDIAKTLLSGVSAANDIVDSAYYLAQNPDVARSKWKNDAQGHYDKYGKGEGRMAAADVVVGPDYSYVLKENETYATALQRLSVSLSGVNGMLDTLNLKLYDTSIAGGDMASKLVDLFGGLEKMQATSSAYFGSYYSEQEKVDIATRQLSKTFADLGFVMPAATEAGKAQLRAQIEAQQALGESGQAEFVQLMGLSGSFAALTDATGNLASAAKSATDILSEQADLQKQYNQLTMTAAQLRAEERKSIDASNLALYDSIAVHNDQAAAAAAAAEIASERKGLESQLMQAMGDTAGLRAQELAGLNAANRGLQEWLYTIADAKAAFDGAKTGAQTAYGNLEKSVNADKSALTAQLASDRDAIAKKYQLQADANKAQVDAAQKVSSAIGSIASALSNAVKQVQIESAAFDFARLQSARTLLSGAVNAPDLSKVVGIEDALGTAGKDSKQFYGTFEEYAFAQGQTAGVIASLNDKARSQLTTAEAIVQGLAAQSDVSKLLSDAEIAAAQAIYDSEVVRLDAVLANGLSQINALLGIDTRVLSVADAVAALGTSITAAYAAQAAQTAALASAVAVQTAASQAASAATAGYGSGYASSGKTYSNEQLAAMGFDPAQIKNEAQYMAGGAPVAGDNSLAAYVDTQLQTGLNSLVQLIGYNATTNTDNTGRVYSNYLEVISQFSDAQKTATNTAGHEGFSQQEIASILGMNGSHANGLDSVPFDGYKAELHKGEMVLPAHVAQSVRGSGNSASNAELAAALRDMADRLDKIEANTRATAGHAAGTDRKLARVMGSSGNALKMEAAA